MPNCKTHPDCDLICSECGSYYCQSDSHDSVYWFHVNRFNHSYNSDLKTPKIETPLDDMPDDREAYYNERAERMP